MSTLQATNLKHGSSASNNLVLDANGNVTAAGTVAMATPFGMRNKIINGAMEIDQRAATVTSTNYTLDRWYYAGSQASKVTIQKNAGSVTPPVGFTSYLGITSSSSYSVTGNELFQIMQIVEGFNCADFGWGTASPKSATLSFWVYSSLTGTFGGSLATAKTTVWVMPFTYSIPVANTWTYVTVAVPGSASATPHLDNQAGIYVRFGLGSAGTSSGGTAGTWTSAGNYIQPAGTVSVVSTNGATFYITGVQLEVGSVATPFERRLYGQELALCQRYCELASGAPGRAYSGTAAEFHMSFKVTKRTTPTIALNPNGQSNVHQPGVINTSAAFQYSFAQNENHISFGLNSMSGLTANTYCGANGLNMFIVTSEL